MLRRKMLKSKLVFSLSAPSSRGLGRHPLKENKALTPDSPQFPSFALSLWKSQAIVTRQSFHSPVKQGRKWGQERITL